MKKWIMCVVLAVLLLTGCTQGAGGEAVSGQASSPASTVRVQMPEKTDTASAEPSLPAASEKPADTADAEMTVSSSGIKDDVIDAKYGHSLLSLPIEISGAPEGTVCFALYMDDPDAVPVCGYRFVHWMAVNIKDSILPEDFSRQAGENAVQGKNDFGKSAYGGPAPPDKGHTYVITVYALDAELPLSEGFSGDEFKAAVKDHTLASATLEGLYKK